MIEATSSLLCGNTTMSGSAESASPSPCECCSRIACVVSARSPYSPRSFATSAVTASGCARDGICVTELIVVLSKPRQVWMRKLPLMHMHSAELGAARERRDAFTGIQQRLGVERALDREKALEHRGLELRAHAADLLDANAVLARDRPADVDAQLQDSIAELDGALLVAGLVRVEQDQRMQVAITSVEHVRARQPELDRPVLDLTQHARQRGARNRAVDAVIIGRDAADRGKRSLA